MKTDRLPVMCVLPSLLRLWLVLPAVFCVPQVFASETENALQAIKSRLPFISLNNYLYNRKPTDYTTDGRVNAAWGILRELNAPQFQTPELLALCDHHDASLRALALLALVAKETPDFVPVCLKLMNDQTSVLPEHIEFGNSFPGPHEVSKQPLTVSAVARAALRMVGCQITETGQAAATVRPDPASWWKERNANPDWLAWHEFLYKRATGGATPVQDATRPAIKRFMAKVDALPRVTRAWVLLYLADDIFMVDGYWQDYYASEQEMIQAAKSLGAEALVDFLKTGKRKGLHEPLLDDPGKGRRFLVTYAKQLFSSAQAADLMDLKLFTAAADADPSLVRKAAGAAMAHFEKPYQSWDRAKMMAALADLGDAADRAAAVKWFYEEPDHNQSTPQSIFIKAVEQRHPKAWEELVHLMVIHPDFEKLIPMDTLYLALMVNRLGGGKIIDLSRFHGREEQEIQDVRQELKVKFGAP